jgi:hypothetical protein
MSNFSIWNVLNELKSLSLEEIWFFKCHFKHVGLIESFKLLPLIPKHYLCQGDCHTFFGLIAKSCNLIFKLLNFWFDFTWFKKKRLRKFRFCSTYHTCWPRFHYCITNYLSSMLLCTTSDINYFNFFLFFHIIMSMSNLI